MAHSWNEIGEQEAWALDADELKLLPGMTDKGRLGFAIQLKFRQIRDRGGTPEPPKIPSLTVLGSLGAKLQFDDI